MSYKEAFEKPDRAEWLRQDVWPPDVFLIYPKADEATRPGVLGRTVLPVPVGDYLLSLPLPLARL